MRVSWLWLLPALALGALVGYMVGDWLLPRYGQTAIRLLASALVTVLFVTARVFLAWELE